MNIEEWYKTTLLFLYKPLTPCILYSDESDNFALDIF